MTTAAVPHILKVLADPTRLRILALLDREELAVGEIARCIAVSQSRVSNHLKILRESGMLAERREGSYTFCRLATGTHLPADLWGAVQRGMRFSEVYPEDEARLAEVMAERRRRSQSFFDGVAKRWDVIGRDFVHGTTRLQAITRLVSRELVVADIGCGTGYLATALAQVVDRVICVDHSEGMLDEARKNLEAFDVRVEMRRGELDELPLANGEVDAVLGHMVLHHLVDPTRALQEAHRALRPGGRLVLTDLLPHRQAWMIEEMGDVKLGVDRHELARRLNAADFIEVETREIEEDRYQVRDPAGKTYTLPLFLASGVKPSTNGNARSDVPGSRTPRDPRPT